MPGPVSADERAAILDMFAKDAPIAPAERAEILAMFEGGPGRAPVYEDNDAGYQLPGQYVTRDNEGVRASVKASAYGGSMERVARSMLGPNASQRDINNYVGQLLEINGINDPRRVQAGQDILLPDANTPAATKGLAIYGKDIALGEHMKVEAAQAQRERWDAMQTGAWSGRTDLGGPVWHVGGTQSMSRSAVDMIPTGGYAYSPAAPQDNEPRGFFGKVADALDSFQRTNLGHALQGLPPEGFILGGVKTGLNALSKLERIGDAALGPASEVKLGLQTLDPTIVSFTQSSVSYGKAGASYNLDTLVKSMSKDGWVGKPIDVVAMPDGTLASIDNTRVLAARQAGINVETNVRGFDEVIIDPVRRLSLTEKGNVPGTWGDAALLRINKPIQNATYPGMNPGWSVRFPYGSIYDPVVKY